jgi:hypothetical protein
VLPWVGGGASGELSSELVIGLTVDGNLQPTGLEIGHTFAGSGGFQAMADLGFGGVELDGGWNPAHSAFAISATAGIDLTDPRLAGLGRDLFGAGGRRLLERLHLPEPWASTIAASLALIDSLEQQIAAIERELRRLGAAHRSIPLLITCPGIAWILGYTIAAEIGDISRFANPRKLIGYTGLTPRVDQSGERDRRGPLTKHGPSYLRWALLEATMHALRHPAYSARYQRTKKRLGKQRGAKVAQVDIARRLAHAIWHMLTRNQEFAPRGAAVRLAA